VSPCFDKIRRKDTADAVARVEDNPERVGRGDALAEIADVFALRVMIDGDVAIAVNQIAGVDHLAQVLNALVVKWTIAYAELEAVLVGDEMTAGDHDASNVAIGYSVPVDDGRGD
jgi:hypothetical protein